VYRAGLYQCRGCQRQFRATINTILEDSNLPIRTLLMAFSILCSAKKPISEPGAGQKKISNEECADL